MKIEHIILVSFVSYFLSVCICLITTTNLEKKWYEWVYLTIPGFNLIWTLYSLDVTISLLKMDLNFTEHRLEINQRRLEGLNHSDNKKPRKIKVGDSIVYPNNELWREEIRGKIGTIVEITNDGISSKVDGVNDIKWTTTWDSMYRNNVIVISNDVLKPFKFVE